jgi:hypothetical protein
LGDCDVKGLASISSPIKIGKPSPIARTMTITIDILLNGGFPDRSAIVPLRTQRATGRPD